MNRRTLFTTLFGALAAPFLPAVAKPSKTCSVYMPRWPKSDALPFFADRSFPPPVTPAQGDRICVEIMRRWEQTRQRSGWI